MSSNRTAKLYHRDVVTFQLHALSRKFGLNLKTLVAAAVAAWHRIARLEVAAAVAAWHRIARLADHGLINRHSVDSPRNRE